MDYDELIANVIELLQREKRVPYRSLKRRFNLGDDYIEDLKLDLIEAKQLAIDENDRILVWVGDAETASAPVVKTAPAPEPVSYTPPHLANKILTSRSALEGERKQVTVLFVDIANSTSLAEQLGPEVMHTLLNQFFALLLEEVHRFEGTANQFLGDGAMCLFGAPIAHEDHARRAVLAALGLQRRIQAWWPELAKQYEVDFAVRMGLNSGLVVVGSIGDNLRMDYSAIGDTTNVSARLQTIAAPGTILVSDATARLVQGTIRLEPLPPVEVKGKAESLAVFNVIGSLPQRSPISNRGDRTLSAFVGRERELITLDELLVQAESGQGQVVGIVAEAGQGKSRLLYEFLQRLEDKPITYLAGRCLSYGQASPYHPIIDIVRHHCGVVETDRPETISANVRTILQEVGMEPEQSAPYLLQLLGVKEGTESLTMLTPEAVRMRTFETLRQMSVNGAQRHPLMVEVEDLHWVDQTSEAYLASLVENLAGAKILLLTSYRPGYQPPWLGKSYATQLSLQHLAPQEALTVIHSTDPEGVLTDHLAQTIIEKAEGNPFFLEELARTIVESSESTVEMAVPDTIQGVLSARIDRLPESDKQLLQTASVLGREFSFPLVQAIWNAEDDVKLMLQELKRQEFLFERTGVDEPLYVFKHALTQDVAYESLLNARRQDLHRIAGQALERLYADRLEEVYYPLAHHYFKANEAAKAVAYLDLLIDKAMQSYAYAEAVMMGQQALVQAEQLIDERNDTVIELAIRQAESLFWLGRRQESIDFLLSHQARLEVLQNAQLAGHYYLWLGYTYCFQGERQLAQQSLNRALAEGTTSQSAVIMGRAHTHLATEIGFAGDTAQAHRHAQQALELLEDTTAHYWLGTALYFLGLSYNATGRLHEAIEVSTRLQQMGELIGDRRLQTNALTTKGAAYRSLGEDEASLETLEHALMVSPDAFESAWALGLLGYTQLKLGDVIKALTTLEHAVEQADLYRSRQVQSMFRSFLGEAYSQNRQFQQAYHIASQGLQLAEEIQYPGGILRARHTLGRIAYASGDWAEAEMHFQGALKSMREHRPGHIQSQLYLDLAILARTQGNFDTAALYLCKAYTAFQKLQIPKYVERTEQLAQEYGVTLVEVELDDLTEGGG